MYYDDPLTVEFLSISRGLQLCVLLGLEKVTVESDAQVAIHAINQGEESYTQHAIIIKEIL